MQIPENPYRKSMANMYMERYMGKGEDDSIRRAVNGDDEVKSIDYYIAAERFISRAVNVLLKSNTPEIQGGCIAFTKMATYVAYEIERLSAMKDTN